MARTGHEDPSKDESALDWSRLATGVDTLIFLMGVGNLPQIVDQLVAHGRPADTPVALVHEALHHAGLTEYPHDRHGLCSDAINGMIMRSCGF